MHMPRRQARSRRINPDSSGEFSTGEMGSFLPVLAPNPATFVARMRLDAALYDAPAPQPAGKRGPKPKKGARQPSLRERLLDPKTRWIDVRVRWYAKEEKLISYTTGVALWHKRGQ